MEERVRLQLRDLNRQFYNTFAGAFTNSRTESEPGFQTIVAQITPGERVLDLGCGQARLAHLLPGHCDYVGVDFSMGMIRQARERVSAGAAELQEQSVLVRFVVADLVDDPWWEQVGDHFNWVVLRAVLHHIPAYRSRRQIVERAAGLLTPHGHLVLANWQFLQIQRLRRRILPWSTIGLAPTDVEPGDYLLDWQRQGHGLRYVHLIDEEETAALAQDTGLKITSLFRADGHTNDLTLYAVLRPAG